MLGQHIMGNSGAVITCRKHLIDIFKVAIAYNLTIDNSIYQGPAEDTKNFALF